jgi:hypothetical protein
MKQLLLVLFFFTCFTIAQGQTIKKASKPEKDFEKFWTTFKDNYAFFNQKGVNWDSTYIKYRPLVTKKTKEKELVSILGQMVEPLKDGHITISKGEEILYKGKKPSYFRQEFKGLEKEFWQTINKTLLLNNFTEPKGIGPVFKEENLYYVSENTKYGYIRITRCFANSKSIFDDQMEDADTKLMLALFDSLLTSFSNKKALIIDLRTNGGGHGGIELASRFVKEKTLTHYKAIRKKGGYENFTEPEPNYIEPNNGVRFLKPVVILTNDKTASSAEDFAISLYQQSNITTIGTNTSGMLSDMFGTDLSTNISFTLSNQRYYSTDKKILEDLGVPVKIEIKNSKADITKGTDPVIVKAIETLNEQKNGS